MHYINKVDLHEESCRGKYHIIIEYIIVLVDHSVQSRGGANLVLVH